MTTIGIVGGTGDLGPALAIHLARKQEVLLGSRIKSKAESVIKDILREKAGRDYLEEHLRPADNHEVASLCDMILLTVPHEHAVHTVEGLASNLGGDKILISAVAPVRRSGDEFRVDFASEGKSISQEIANVVPQSVRVATAFQTVPANVLYKEKPIASDVLVATDEYQVYQQVATVVSRIEGLRPLYLGSLSLSGEIERMTALLLNIGIRNRLKSPTPKFNSF